jgi:hypothetical protein
MSGAPRRLRFSVRSLLALMALVSPILAILTNFDIGALAGYCLLLITIVIMGIVVWDALFDSN